MLYKHIIQVENKNEGLKVCVGGWGVGHKHTIAPNQKGGGGDFLFNANTEKTYCIAEQTGIIGYHI